MTDLTLVRGDVILRATVTGSGATVLLLHAGAETRTVWRSVATRLSEDGFRTVAFDLRAHGESTGRADTLRAIADDVADMVRREREPIVVVGASLGGLAALVALSEPAVAALVAGLVLVDVTPDPSPRRVRSWLSESGLLGRFEDLVEDILASGQERLESAASLDVPVLLVRAGRSVLEDADVDRFRRANSRVGVVRVPVAGHLIAREAPAELATILATYATGWLRTDGSPE